MPQADFILAENEEQAKKIAVEYIKTRTSNNYGDKDIIRIKDITNGYFYTEEDINRITESLKI